MDDEKASGGMPAESAGDSQDVKDVAATDAQDVKADPATDAQDVKDDPATDAQDVPADSAGDSQDVPADSAGDSQDVKDDSAADSQDIPADSAADSQDMPADSAGDSQGDGEAAGSVGTPAEASSERDERAEDGPESPEGAAPAVSIVTTSEPVETPEDHQGLEPAADRDGPDSEVPEPPPTEPADPTQGIYVEPTIDMTASEAVDFGLERPTPEDLGERVSVESAQNVEPAAIPAASEAGEGPGDAVQVSDAGDGGAAVAVAPSEPAHAASVPAKDSPDETKTGEDTAGPAKVPQKISSLVLPQRKSSFGAVGTGSAPNTTAGGSDPSLRRTPSGASSESVVEAYSGKVALVRVPTVLIEATESEARLLMGLPEIPPEPTQLERIWQEPVQFYDIRSILSQIWAKDETVFHSLLSEIWESPAVRSTLSEIWDEAVQLVEPKSVLSEIWTEPPKHIDIRSVLSQIWNDDNKERVMSILSEIWSTPAMQSILSEIWGSAPVSSVLSDIWLTPVEKVDIRSILSQIWSHDNDQPPPKSILSEIWETPAVRAVLSEIWGSPHLGSVLWEIWKEPVHKVDIRSILSQIWSSDNDVHIRSILSEIWATPAARSVLSEIWSPQEEFKPVKDTHADYRVTESEMLLEELIEDLQHSDGEAPEQMPEQDQLELLVESEEKEALKERRHHRVHRYAAATEDEELPASRPLTTRWAFGSSCKAPAVNLTSSGSSRIAYAAAQAVVVYDYCKNTQHILQGHRNCVCGLAASPTGRWLVTGDIGDDNALIVWDSSASAPLQMHFPAWLFSGPLWLAFSCDSRYVLALWGAVCAAGDGGARQQLTVWDWTLDQAAPEVVYEYGTHHGFHEHLAVSSMDPLVLATTASCRVIFFHMVNGKTLHHCPELRNKYSPDFKCNPGNFSQTAFSTTDPYAAITGTSKGYVIVWSDRRPSAPIDTSGQPPTVNKEARKVLKITDSPITCVQFVDGVICAGTAAGELRFLDDQLRLLYWYPNFELASVRSMSFSLEPVHSYQQDLEAASGAGDSRNSSPRPVGCGNIADVEGPFPGDASLEAAEFVLRDILVTTGDGYCGLIHVRSSSIRRLAEFPVTTVRAIDVHRKKPLLVIAAYDGSVRVWNYEQRELVDQTHIEGNNRIHSIAFSPSGLHLAAGMQNGDLVILDALTLGQESARFQLSRAAITQCLFSPDSDLLATRDDDLVVSVYRFVADSQQWVVLGRWRAHYQPVAELLFAPSQEDPSKPRLLSLGEDRVLVEYDLVNSTKEKPLLVCCDTLEQQAVPLCMALYPQLTTEDFILVSNSQYKMKLYNAHTRMCRRVTCGPQYGAPIERMKVIPRMMNCDAGTHTEQHSYLAFSTCGKLGLQVLPLDGNRRKAAAVIGHPTKVECIDCSTDGRWLFSAGGEDGCVFLWEICPESLEAMSLLGGSGMTPFYDELEGGTDGPLYQQLEDLVYYAQLLCQGEDLLEEREVSQKVPLHMVTDIMRAIGFFPTEKQIEDMTHEVRYRDYGQTGQLVEEVHLDDIIRLYVNHRAAAGAGEVRWALNALERGGKHSHSASIGRKDLVRALQVQGEHCSEKELAAVLAELLDPEAENLPLGVPLETVEKMLPKVISLESFCSDLLGMPELVGHPATADTLPSAWSRSPSAASPQ